MTTNPDFAALFDQALTLPAGRELDVIVAKALGYEAREGTFGFDESNTIPYWDVFTPDGERIEVSIYGDRWFGAPTEQDALDDTVPLFSTDLNAAWALVSADPANNDFILSIVRAWLEIRRDIARNS